MHEGNEATPAKKPRPTKNFAAINGACKMARLTDGSKPRACPHCGTNSKLRTCPFCHRKK